MPCYKPLHGWRSRAPGNNGGFGIVFRKENSNGQPMAVPCGQCIGCKLQRSQQWAVRCAHEMKLHEENCFATFTYAPEKLPYYGSLVPHHFQDFMKKLRRRIEPQRVRYFQCGEYGDEYDRPHHHAILFGFSPNDAELFGYSNGEPLYTSKFLEEVWGHGYVVIGSATFESAAYIARYCTKKITGEKADEHYERCDPITGEIYSLVPEYGTMSRSPGIGRDHFEKFLTDVFPSDEVIHEGRVLKPPRYYADLYRANDPTGWDEVRSKRAQGAKAHAHDNTPERLAQREQVKIAQFNQLKRGYENNEY